MNNILVILMSLAVTVAIAIACAKPAHGAQKRHYAHQWPKPHFPSVTKHGKLK